MSETTPRRRRWPWVVAGVLLLGVSILPATYLYVRWQGNRELAAIRAELDAADPNWRMPDLFAARNADLERLPVNSADTAANVAKLLPEGWDKLLGEDRWHSGDPPNRLPTADEASRIRAVHGRTASARDFALALRDQPTGGTVIVVHDFRAYMMNLNLTAVQERRGVASLLAIAAAVAALDDVPAESVSAVRAGLNLARSIGDEPFLISQLVRLACTAIAVRSAERTLGLCQSDNGLAELQAAFEREAGERFMRAGLMGELASVDQVMTNMQDGTANGAAAGLPSGPTMSPYWPHDRAAGLRMVKTVADAAGRPPHDRAAAAEAERALMSEPRIQVPLSRLLAPAVTKVVEADGRTQAQVTTAAVGIACERYRRKHDRFPDALAILVPEFLPAVPADPFDGKPLRYKQTPDGATVYSVGQNLTDDGGTAAERATDGDVVFRLFAPAHRRLPPLPPAPTDQP